MPRRNCQLYVIGASSPNPEDWKPWDEYALVLAASQAQAREIAGVDESIPVTKVPNKQPVLLARFIESGIEEM